MALIISQIEIPFDEPKENIIIKAKKKLAVKSEDILVCEIYKTSLDARRQNNIKISASVYFELSSEKLEKQLMQNDKSFSFVDNSVVSPVIGNEKLNSPIVIAGFGPAGMFAALTLAEYGYNPIVFERGDDVDSRVKKVSSFWTNGKLDEESNVQFGEGGAGTFSDGKLTTRIKDPLCQVVLRKFVEFGAPSEIVTKAKPHIGTDNLRKVVKNIRERIIKLGGKVYFNTPIQNIVIKNSCVTGIIADGNELHTDNLILAVGHSARDTFKMLLEKGIFIEPKPFSVGARIEHTQESVNKSLYGKYFDSPLLPQGEYQLSYKNGTRCAYTFCMCPGGFVVPSASEENTVVTNGMSEFSRNQENANSALVVSVSPEDFGNKPLDGVDFARTIEKSAFLLGEKKYSAPAVSVGNFLDKKCGISENAVTPSYSLGVCPADFDKLFPSYITETMRDGIRDFSRKMSCFGDKNAIMTGAETRTSSPVRITRNESLASVSINNLYPCGEGAGYAGGIMSAAVDGMKIAFKLMEKYSPK